MSLYEGCILLGRLSAAGVFAIVSVIAVGDLICNMLLFRGEREMRGYLKLEPHPLCLDAMFLPVFF